MTRLYDFAAQVPQAMLSDDLQTTQTSLSASIAAYNASFTPTNSVAACSALLATEISLLGQIATFLNSANAGLSAYVAGLLSAYQSALSTATAGVPTSGYSTAAIATFAASNATVVAAQAAYQAAQDWTYAGLLATVANLLTQRQAQLNGMAGEQTPIASI